MKGGHEDLLGVAISTSSTETMLASRRTSLQFHEHKHETIYVLKGGPDMELDGESYHLAPGDQVLVKPKKVHRMTVVLEASTRT